MSMPNVFLKINGVEVGMALGVLQSRLCLELDYFKGSCGVVSVLGSPSQRHCKPAVLITCKCHLFGGVDASDKRNAMLECSKSQGEENP